MNARLAIYTGPTQVKQFAHIFATSEMTITLIGTERVYVEFPLILEPSDHSGLRYQFLALLEAQHGTSFGITARDIEILRHTATPTILEEISDEAGNVDLCEIEPPPSTRVIRVIRRTKTVPYSEENGSYQAGYSYACGYHD